MTFPYSGRFHQLRGFVRDWGLRDTIERGLCKVAGRVLGRGFRKTAVPSLETLCADAKRVFHNVHELLTAYCSIEPDEMASLRVEFDTLTDQLARRYDRQLSHPPSWAFGDGSAFALYAIIRTMQPQTVVETGVANGHSSFYILSALERNARPGTLHSIDIAPNVGVLVDPAERARWNLHILPASASKEALLGVLATLPRIDIMIHDSDHSYRWMLLELEQALPRMSDSALFFCDDINLCFAWTDFCKGHALEQIVLVDTVVDTIKVLGLAPLGQPFAKLANRTE